MCSNPSLLCCCRFLARQRCYLLLKLFGVRCGVNEGGGGGMCEKREGTKEEGEGRGEGRGEGGGEDDGTGVEFTHPAGSAYYWHTCFSVMNHPCYGESEGKCGFLSE